MKLVYLVTHFVTLSESPRATSKAPGQRISNFYAGHFRDPDGNKLNAFCFNDLTI